ncbi:hypothetical protein GOB94_00480 [Granulicella sp. 5B5]|uniref:hypothetical protein n=1 Tax=Granulicella sp. 5B5 TaxID=1617967 RepID=UPI0015F5B72D|nr:hypothetical protein [Granulicella sp. 5B5]QMV17356.1 hypothetical protein GOB94_00480 [Granulicella sp. 5B5]
MVLVLAGASRWVVTEVRPDAEPTLSSLAMGCGWAALVSLMLLRRGPARVSLRSSWLGVLAGAMVFAGPAVGALMHARGLDGPGLTMALALTPVAAGIASAALGMGSLDGAAGRIWPGLAAVGGLLLVLAEPSLANGRTDVALLLAPVLTGVGAALFCVRGGATSWRASSALLGGTLVFAVALTVESVMTRTRPAVSLLAMACDGLLALLSIYALQRLGATRWSAQFTLLPLLVVLEGLVLAHQPLTLRWVVGIALLLLASVYLLLPSTEDMEQAVGVVPR